MIVVDASVVYETLLGSAPARERLSHEKLIAPQLIQVEVMNALRRRLLAKMISPKRAEEALEDYDDTYIILFNHAQLMGRAWELRDNVTPYDAMYVALAEWFGVPLVTMDATLAGAPGVKASVEVLPVG